MSKPAIVRVLARNLVEQKMFVPALATALQRLENNNQRAERQRDGQQQIPDVRQRHMQDRFGIILTLSEVTSRTSLQERGSERLDIRFVADL